ERLVNDGSLRAAESVQAAYVYHLAKAARATSHIEQNTRQWLDRLDAEHESIRSAVRWCLNEGDDRGRAAEIVVALARYLYRRRQREGGQWLETLCERAAELAPEVRAAVFDTSAMIRPHSADTLTLAQRAVAAYRELDDPGGLSHALDMYGQTLFTVGRAAEALDVLAESARLARGADGGSETRSTLLLGFAQVRLGDSATARATLEGALGRARELHEDAFTGACLYGLAETALVDGDAEAAIEHAGAAVAVFEEISDERSRAWATQRLAQAFLEAGRIDDAVANAMAALSALRDAQLPLSFFETLIVLGVAFAATGDDARAEIATRGARELQRALWPLQPAPSTRRLAAQLGLDQAPEEPAQFAGDPYAALDALRQGSLS
ncbi:MAG: hypothetical protein JOZ01_09490, partial [Candidatus Eremiobacteraeota bacterium]|nr:hypothetical protein [Candidatus Eremiobacteraeota bacterium]